VAESPANPIVEPPSGMYPARLDDKGRLKLPQPFVRYLDLLPEKTLFVTSLDRTIAQIYPKAVWRQNEAFFEGYRDDPDAAADIAFNAADLGAETEMDGQGRVTFSSELRRALGIENQPVRLFARRGRIEVLSEAVYGERRERASKDTAAKVRTLETAGLK